MHFSAIYLKFRVSCHNPLMALNCVFLENQYHMIVLAFFLTFFSVKAQNPSIEDMPTTMVSNFQASLAVVIAILSLMFFLTFILLVYAKFCRISTAPRVNNQPFIRSISRSSGIDKTVIESLPFFRFSSIKGAREGLDCAVCLCRFEDIEVLRLLPKCKHAFHIDCVDQWLEKHSSCPLCRQKVKVDDLTTFAHSTSLRFSRNQSEPLDESNLGIFIQREEDEHQSRRGSSRFSIGGSFRGSEKDTKEEELPIQENKDEILHKFNHKIIVSDAVLKNRWSSVSSSDLMLLNSEMIHATSSNRFSSLDQYNATKKAIEDCEIMNIKEEMDRKRLFETKFSKIDQNGNVISFSRVDSRTSKVLNNSTEKRSMSEITVHPRFKENNMKHVSSSSSSNNSKNEPSLGGNDLKEERMRRLWLPIAGRTVQWFVNREIIRPTDSQHIRKPSNV